ncbi:hypothetical protein [Nocardia sp. NPDC024068]|uniref:hypothetical protein n=1 Tax=Nocardia sp. NPDC024068 TaxID=3157197 RepID=UPI0033F337E5
MPQTTSDPLNLAVEEADAEAAAAEAEALAAQASAAAARARAKAARLRREAGGEDPGSGAGEPEEVAAEVSAVGDDPETTGRAAAGTRPDEVEPEASAEPAGEPESDAVDAESDSAAKADLVKAADPAPDEAAGKVRGRTGRLVRKVQVPALRRPGRRALGRAVAVLVIVVSLVAGGFSLWNHQQIGAAQAREDEYLNAAREGVVALTTLDAARAADDVKRVLDHSTGAFRTDFQTRSEDFTKVVQQSQVATKGEITASAVESMTDESAVVLVSAVSRVTNTAGAQQEPRVWRLSVTVTREGSELKMSKVEFVP